MHIQNDGLKIELLVIAFNGVFLKEWQMLPFFLKLILTGLYLSGKDINLYISRVEAMMSTVNQINHHTGRRNIYPSEIVCKCC